MAIDVRVYLDLERALRQRLLKTWEPHAAETFSPIQDALKQGNVAQAYRLAADIDITPVVARNREYVKYLLLACANFGAQMANPQDTTFVSAGSYSGFLDRIADNFMAMAERSINLQLYEQAVQLIAAAKAHPKQAGELDLGVYAQHALKHDTSAEPRDEKGQWTAGAQAGALPPQAVVHYGNTPNLTALSGSRSGSGIKGAEGRRLQYSQDPAIKKRVYFYLAPGDHSLPKKESGLGNHVYRTTLNNLYDLSADPAGVFQQIAGLTDPDDRANAMESAIVKAGYDGYAVPAYNMAVVLGKDVPVTYDGEATKKSDCGHGHVYPNPNGMKARCGGPGLCRLCAADQATKDASLHLIAKDYVDGDANNLLAPADRYVKDFVSFKQTGDRALQMVSSLHTSRLAAWGFTAEAEALGYEEYQLTAVLDNRTSKFCRWINGRTFKLQPAVDLVNRALSAQTADEIKSVQPWPAQDRASMESYQDMSDDELVDAGWCIPPFHPNCRTLLARVGAAPQAGQQADEAAASDESDQSDEADEGAPTEGAPDQEAIDRERERLGELSRDLDGEPQPQAGSALSNAQREQSFTRTSADSFDELGLDVDPEEVDYWNSYLPATSPAELFAGLLGKDVDKLLDEVAGEGRDHELEHSIRFNKNGDIAFQYDGPLGEDDGQNLSMQTVYDPFSATLYQNYTELDAQSPEQAADTLREYYRSLVDTGQDIDADALVMHAGGDSGLYTYATLGFKISPADWYDLRQGILTDLDGPLADQWSALADATQQAVFALLNADEGAFSALAALPDAQWLLAGRKADLTVDLTDPAAVATFMG